MRDVENEQCRNAYLGSRNTNYAGNPAALHVVTAE